MSMSLFHLIWTIANTALIIATIVLNVLNALKSSATTPPATPTPPVIPTLPVPLPTPAVPPLVIPGNHPLLEGLMRLLPALEAVLKAQAK
jgi:hypothetical protein